MNLETKITIYKFTPQVFTLTLHLSVTDVLDCYVDPRFHPLDNARSERAQKKIPLRNNLRGIIEVPGGFEPPYTVLQTAD